MTQRVLDLAANELVIALGDGSRRLHPLVVLLLRFKNFVKLQGLVLEPLDLPLQRRDAVVVAELSRLLILLRLEPLQLIFYTEHMAAVCSDEIVFVLL